MSADSFHQQAAKLLLEAFHLRQYGENAPGGTETWAEWEKKTEALLRTTRPPYGN